MDDLEEKQQLRFACLDLACRQTILGDNGDRIDLTADEAVTYAEKFYQFVTKKDLN